MATKPPVAGVPKLTVAPTDPNAGAVDAINSSVDKLNDSLAAANVPAIKPTPAVISSKDMSGGFNANSSTLDTKTQGLTNSKGTDLTGTDTTTDAPKTDVDKNAKAGDGKTPSTGTTGDAVYDSLQEWEQGQQAQFEKDAAANKKQYNDLYQNSFAAVDATYQATVQDINTTYAGRVDEQRKINNLDIARTKAYGLASGGALSAPVEFTNAVSQREQQGADKITTLNNERTALIAKAQAARDTGDAALLKTHIDDILGVETSLRAQIADVATEANNQYQMLVGIRKDQEAKQKETATKLLAAATVQYGDEFTTATDSKTKDALIKKIVAASGGALDYATVLGGLSTAATDAQDASLKKAQIAKAWKDVNTPASGSTGDTYATIDQILSLNKGVDSAGNPFPYVDTNGYMTPQGFNAIASNAAEDKLSRADVIAQYGYMLYPGDDGSYSGYSLTGAEKKKISGE